MATIFQIPDVSEHFKINVCEQYLHSLRSTHLVYTTWFTYMCGVVTDFYIFCQIFRKHLKKFQVTFEIDFLFFNERCSTVIKNAKWPYVITSILLSKLSHY